MKISERIDEIWRNLVSLLAKKIFAWGISLFLQKDRFSTGQSKTITFYNLFWLLSIIKLQNNTSSVQFEDKIGRLQFCICKAKYKYSGSFVWILLSDNMW